jgi:hypothetical protein
MFGVRKDPERLALEPDRRGGGLQIRRFAVIDVDPEESVGVNAGGGFSREVDFAIVTRRVVEPSADRQRRKVRIPAKTTAAIAITTSTIRIDRSVASGVASTLSSAMVEWSIGGLL